MACWKFLKPAALPLFLIFIPIFYAYGFTIGNPIGSSSVGDVVCSIAILLAKVGVPIAVVFLLWAGLLFVTARGNEEQLKKAKNAFFWTVVGVALLVGAIFIAEAVLNFGSALGGFSESQKCVF